MLYEAVEVRSYVRVVVGEVRCSIDCLMQSSVVDCSLRKLRDERPRLGTWREAQPCLTVDGQGCSA